MIGLGNGIMFGGMRPLASLVSSILRSYTGSLYLPSPTSCFTDVAGTTPCAVDTTVGLMLDEMRMTLPITDASYALPTGYETGVLSGLSSNGFTITEGTAAQTRAAVNIATVIGQTYTVRFKVASLSGTSVSAYSRTVADGSGATITSSSATTVGVSNILSFTATATSHSFLFVMSTAGTFTISNMDVTSGIHATQATAGYRPKMRGNVLNLLTYSEDLTNAAWAKGTNIAATDYRTLTSTDPSSLRRTTHVIPNATAGLNYTVSFYGTLVSGSGAGKLGIDFAGSTNADITVTSTRTRFTYTRTCGTATNNLVEIYVPATSVWLVEEIQCELGTVANPYVATGATVASSSYGAYYEEFDGLVTRKTLSSVPFQMSDDFFVVVGWTPLNSTAAIFSLGNTGTSAPHAHLYLSGTAARFDLHDDATTSNFISGGTNLLGIPGVVGITKQGSTLKLYINGVLVNTGTLTLGTTTFNTATIGAIGKTTYSNFFNGKLHALEFGKGAITDSQLLTIERYVGQKTGVTI